MNDTAKEDRWAKTENMTPWDMAHMWLKKARHAKDQIDALTFLTLAQNWREQAKAGGWCRECGRVKDLAQGWERISRIPLPDDDREWHDNAIALVLERRGAGIPHGDYLRVSRVKACGCFSGGQTSVPTEYAYQVPFIEKHFGHILRRLDR